MRRRVIAVDGPGGSGKSTVSRVLAQRLGWHHLDTGAYYRAATLAVLEAGGDPFDPVAVLEAIDGRSLDLEDRTMLLDGRDVSGDIRSDRVDRTVSAVSAHPEVRTRMVDLQRSWVDERGGRAVVEGRDIGTVVFPDALVKVYLTAHPVVRAQRRAREAGATPERVADELARRDRYDSSRAASPLQVAADAVTIDTSELSVDEVVDQILALYEET